MQQKFQPVSKKHKRFPPEINPLGGTLPAGPGSSRWPDIFKPVQVSSAGGGHRDGDGDPEDDDDGEGVRPKPVIPPVRRRGRGGRRGRR